MFKKILKQENTATTVFPVQSGISSDGGDKLQGDSWQKIATELSQNQKFLEGLAQLVTANVLMKLKEEYQLEPPQRFYDEINGKQEYIKQLDQYLIERKKINETVESDLQKFLQETSDSLARSLALFSENINSRIHDTEKRHGIEKIKTLLSDKNQAGGV